MTNDTNKSILFSASVDKKIIAWHTKRYDALFEINLEHPVATLRLTKDNEILLAIGDYKVKKMSTLLLEENLGSARLNIPREV